MDAMHEQIQTEINLIEKNLPLIVYNILEKHTDTSIKILKEYDDALTQHTIKLDTNITIERTKRKTMIVKIQSIQKTIDALINKEFKNNNIIEILMHHIHNTNTILIKQLKEIEELKSKIFF